jgi:hypothetical protein
MTAIAKDQAPLEFENEVVSTRALEAGGMTIAFERMSAGVETAPLFVGLPDDGCQSPHWGYALKGRFRVTYTDGAEEVVEAGQAYYLPPGHNVDFEEDSEIVELSPVAARQATMAHVASRLEAAAAGA